MRPTEALVAELPGFGLRFDLPVGRGERGVANVVPRRQDRVWGVAYRISREELARLDRSEGVHRGFYHRIAVRLRDRDGAELGAWTYHSPRGCAGRKPSRRYLGLLLAGARYHDLPGFYLEELRQLELAHDERDPQRALPFADAGTP